MNGGNMKELTTEQIQENWNRLIQIIKDTFEEESERRENLLGMYQYFEDRMCMAPASGKEHFHNAHVGGYVEHVLHVIDCSVKLKKLWEDSGASIDFTDEELIFAAMHHDLGKVGDMDKDYYVPQESEWHRKNQGKIYGHNPDLSYMNVTDRSMWLLQHFGVKITDTEYLGIKLADGLYEDGNKSYYMSYNPDFELQSNLPHIIHQADMIASKTERDVWKYNDSDSPPVVAKPTNNIQEQKKVDNLKDKFDELFA